MRLAAAALVVTACGRVAFDELPDALPDAPPLQTVALALCAGGLRTCAIANGEVVCWGLSDFGAGVRPLPEAVPATGPFIGIETGDGGACALPGDGTAWCWGTNRNGQLGFGIDQPIVTPQQLLATGVTQITIGYHQTCVRHQDGGVSCAGRGDLIGDGSGVTKYELTRVPGLTDVIGISAGDAHTCALRRDGSVACWGENGDGQLGDGTQVPAAQPVAGPTGPYDEIAAGDFHTCARRAGAVDCWGNNSNGQLGDGSMQASPSAVTVNGITDATALALGAYFSCALRPGGVVTCWGDGSVGALGDGTLADRPLPAASVMLPEPAVELSARTSAHACAHTASGSIYCWGSNTTGQIGDGTTNVALVPVQVMGLP